MKLDLSARLPHQWHSPSFVALVTEDEQTSALMRPKTALLLREADKAPSAMGGFAITFRIGSPTEADRQAGVLSLPADLNYLKAGDIVRVSPAGGEVRVIYRKGSPHNVLFITERCNSRCLMCSQPPREVDDRHHLDDLLAAIPLMDPDATPELCITGGEPMLAGERIFEIVRAVKDCLPRTALHMLSNGRLFRRLALAKQLAAVGHPDLMIGVPIYSDIASRHDFVVQAKGAYDETIRGLLNLDRVGVGVELRVVIHRQTVDRLGDLARFIARNLPFVRQVALMGLEMAGYTRSNLEALWIDPYDYQRELSEAVDELATAKQRVMIYNHPLCVLPEELWPFARRSISDWKNIFLAECQPCVARDHCGGFFASAAVRHSAHLRPVLPPRSCSL